MLGSGLVAWVTRYRTRTSPALEGILEPAVQKRMEATIPAVVAPAFNATGLGIVRDLGRAGVPVIAVDHYPKSIGLTSRYAVPVVSRDPRYDEEGLLQDLERIGAALPRRAVLFPAFDDHVWAFSRHAERLEKYFILPFARWATMQRLADKETQMQAAWAAGVDTPRTFFVHGPDDLEEAAREVPFPALFKPLRHQEMRRRFGVKVVLAETAADLAAAYEKASICGGLMLQEIVPGDDQAFYTFGAYHDASSRPLGQFISRKIRQHPRDFGESRIAVSDWVPDVAAAEPQPARRALLPRRVRDRVQARPQGRPAQADGGQRAPLAAPHAVHGGRASTSPPSPTWTPWASPYVPRLSATACAGWTSGARPATPRRNCVAARSGHSRY